MILNVKNETSTLRAVVLGQPKSMGKVPEASETYDAKSYESVVQDKYPGERIITDEMGAFEQVLERHGVHVFRPKIIENYNQVFARDVAFVIDDRLIVSNILPDRVDEQEAYETIFSTIDFKKIFNLPEKVHVEGGDVVLMDDTIFIGVYSDKDYPNLKTARTNLYAVDFLRELFPTKTFIPLELTKNDRDPRKGILHLDCTFMPVGSGKAILYRNGFRNEKEYHSLVDYFGKENIFEITEEEMYFMNTNIFSISPDIVVSEQNFIRLNCYMEEKWGMTVERIPYYEISKMGGLLRCSTLPLIRKNE